MSDIVVLKRDGSEEALEPSKLAESIFGAAISVGGEDMDLAEDLAYKVLDIIESNEVQEISSDELQKLVEDTLINEGHATTARQYILKGADRRRIRELDSSLIQSFQELTFQSEEESNTKRENANIDSSTSMGTMLKYGSESAKSFNLSYLMSEDIAEAHKNCDIHIHDLDFFSLTSTCNQIPIDKLFRNGFNTGHGFLREPGNIRTAGALAAIALQSDQNDQHGGQSIPMLDHYLAPYVALSYIGNIARETKSKLDLTKDDRRKIKIKLKVTWKEHKRLMNEDGNRILRRELKKCLDELCIKYTDAEIDSIFKNAYDDTYDDTFQSMEGLVHNLNTMHCLPASERIWVLDTKTNTFGSISMELLYKLFEPKRFMVISLNKNTGKSEFKYITACQNMGNNRNIVEITDNQGRTVRVTDNHKVMTVDGANIVERYPSDCKYTISPRGIDFESNIKYIDMTSYGKPRSDNPFQGTSIEITEEFAEFMGYYMADGCMLGETSTCCISACGKVSFEYMESLLNKVFNCNLKTSYTYFKHSVNGTTEKDIRIQVGMPLARMIKDKFGRVGKEKHIPLEILWATDSIKKSFLKAYFALGGRKDKKYAEVSTINKELQCQTALMISSLKASNHYSTRKCNDGFKVGNRLDMHFVSMGSLDSYNLGLVDSLDTKFDIPKYNLNEVCKDYKSVCNQVSNNRSSGKLRYNELEELVDSYGIKELNKFKNTFINDIVDKEEYNSKDEDVYDISVEDNETFLTYECIFVHNSRAGAQVPFSSVNYGTDISTEGRMIQETILKTTWKGLGNGETPIFPIQILKLKKGINVNPEDPCYDIFELACKVSAKRLYPNFVNLDAPYNAELYVEGHPETEMATMGCRTRVGKNVYDPTNSVIPGRGNLSFTSINLPRLGLKAEKDMNKFYRLLDAQLELVHRELLERLEVISKRKPLNYPFLMGQGCWLGSENLGPTDDLHDIWKHGTLTVGFIGLAETLVALTGKHHGESEESQKLGLEIVSYMRNATDKWAEKEHLNYSLIGTPAEGLSGRFIRSDKKLFGIIPGVTDRDYYTNSSHVPVYYKISAKKKIDIEAPYHELENGGHIMYIEMDGDPTKNIKAFEKVVKYMYNKNAGYMAVNHPVDRDPICGYTGIIDDVCPRCGRKDGEPMTLEMWNKIKAFANVGNAETLGYHGDTYEEQDRLTNMSDDFR